MQDLSAEISVVRSTLVGTPGPVSKILVHPKGKSLTTCVVDSGDVQLWNLNGTKQQPVTVSVQKAPIQCVIRCNQLAMEGTGAILAASGNSLPCPVSLHSLIPHFEGCSTVRLFDNPISSLAFFANDVLLSGSTDGLVRLSFRGSKDRKPKVLSALSTGEGAVHHATRVGDRQEIVSGTQSGKVQLWDLTKGTVKSTIRLGTSPILKVTHLPQADRSLALQVFLAATNDGRACLVDLKSETIVSEVSGLSGNRETTVLHPKENTLLATGIDGVFKAIDLKTNTPLFSIKRQRPPTALAFSPQGDRLFMGNSGGIVEEVEFARLLHLKEFPLVHPIKPKFNEDLERKNVLLRVDKATARVSGLEKDLSVVHHHRENARKT